MFIFTTCAFHANGCIRLYGTGDEQRRYQVGFESVHNISITNTTVQEANNFRT